MDMDERRLILIPASSVVLSYAQFKYARNNDDVLNVSRSRTTASSLKILIEVISGQRVFFF